MPASARALASAANEDSIEDLLARGRASLAAGRAAEAQALFEQAAAKDSNSLRTRAWVIRSWMQQGRINDALDETDKLSTAGEKGPAIDYLYGMAFALKAREYIVQGVQGGIIDMSFADAVKYLASATEADPVLYQDAFSLLAEAAWHMQKLDVARAAAEKALALQPKNATAALMLGKVALSQFVVANGDEGRKAEADAHWEAARAAFEKAAANLGNPTAPGEQTLLAQIHVQQGFTFGWKQKTDEAAREYGAALGFDPMEVDFGQVLGQLGAEKFLAALEDGAQNYEKRFGAASAGDALLRWWLGYARFTQKQYAKADEAFANAVKKSPAFFNSWFYMGLARYQQQDYEGAVAALRRNFDENASDLVASIGSNRDVNLSILDFLIGWCASKTRNLEAAVLSEIQAAVVPEHAPYWNNVGLFYRDAGDALKASDRAEDKQLAASHFDKAYKAYSSALALAPEDPSLLNDTAVMLHYYFHRELDRAREMYKKATERAQTELAKPDLAPDLRKLYTTALRDSKDNLAKLDKGILEN